MKIWNLLPAGKEMTHGILFAGFLKQFRYPQHLAEQGLQGNLIVGFIIDRTGVISHLEIAGSNDKTLYRDIAVILEKSPSWQPGTLDGMPVNTWVRFPLQITVGKP